MYIHNFANNHICTYTIDAQDDDVNTGAIVGGVVGGLAGVILLILLIICDCPSENQPSSHFQN